MESGRLQTKLEVGQPGDIDEQEADRMQWRVLRYTNHEFSGSRTRREKGQKIQIDLDAIWNISTPWRAICCVCITGYECILVTNSMNLKTESGATNFFLSESLIPL